MPWTNFILRVFVNPFIFLLLFDATTPLLFSEAFQDISQNSNHVPKSKESKSETIWTFYQPVSVQHQQQNQFQQPYFGPDDKLQLRNKITHEKNKILTHQAADNSVYSYQNGPRFSPHFMSAFPKQSGFEVVLLIDKVPVAVPVSLDGLIFWDKKHPEKKRRRRQVTVPVFVNSHKKLPKRGNLKSFTLGKISNRHGSTSDFSLKQDTDSHGAKFTETNIVGWHGGKEKDQTGFAGIRDWHPHGGICLHPPCKKIPNTAPIIEEPGLANGTDEFSFDNFNLSPIPRPYCDITLNKTNALLSRWGLDKLEKLAKEEEKTEDLYKIFAESTSTSDHEAWEDPWKTQEITENDSRLQPLRGEFLDPDSELVLVFEDDNHIYASRERRRPVYPAPIAPNLPLHLCDRGPSNNNNNNNNNSDPNATQTQSVYFEYKWNSGAELIEDPYQTEIQGNSTSEPCAIFEARRADEISPYCPTHPPDHYDEELGLYDIYRQPNESQSWAWEPEDSEYMHFRPLNWPASVYSIAFKGPPEYSTLNYHHKMGTTSPGTIACKNGNQFFCFDYEVEDSFDLYAVDTNSVNMKELMSKPPDPIREPKFALTPMSLMGMFRTGGEPDPYGPYDKKGSGNGEDPYWGTHKAHTITEAPIAPIPEPYIINPTAKEANATNYVQQAPVGDSEATMFHEQPVKRTKGGTGNMAASGTVGISGPNTAVSSSSAQDTNHKKYSKASANAMVYRGGSESFSGGESNHVTFGGRRSNIGTGSSGGKCLGARCMAQLQMQKKYEREGKPMPTEKPKSSSSALAYADGDGNKANRKKQTKHTKPSKPFNTQSQTNTGTGKNKNKKKKKLTAAEAAKLNAQAIDSFYSVPVSSSSSNTEDSGSGGLEKTASDSDSDSLYSVPVSSTKAEKTEETSGGSDNDDSKTQDSLYSVPVSSSTREKTEENSSGLENDSQASDSLYSVPVSSSKSEKTSESSSGLENDSTSSDSLYSVPVASAKKEKTGDSSSGLENDSQTSDSLYSVPVSSAKKKTKENSSGFENDAQNSDSLYSVPVSSAKKEKTGDSSSGLENDSQTSDSLYSVPVSSSKSEKSEGNSGGLENDAQNSDSLYSVPVSSSTREKTADGLDRSKNEPSDSNFYGSSVMSSSGSGDKKKKKEKDKKKETSNSNINGYMLQNPPVSMDPMHQSSKPSEPTADQPPEPEPAPEPAEADYEPESKNLYSLDKSSQEAPKLFSSKNDARQKQQERDMAALVRSAPQSRSLGQAAETRKGAVQNIPVSSNTNASTTTATTTTTTAIPTVQNRTNDKDNGTNINGNNSLSHDYESAEDQDQHQDPAQRHLSTPQKVNHGSTTPKPNVSTSTASSVSRASRTQTQTQTPSPSSSMKITKSSASKQRASQTTRKKLKSSKLKNHHKSENNHESSEEEDVEDDGLGIFKQLQDGFDSEPERKK